MTTLTRSAPVQLERLDSARLGFAADLHRAALPHGLFPRLGRRFLRAYYETFAASPHAVARLALVDGTPAGVLVGTTANPPHYRWVVRHRGARLLAAGLLALTVRPRVALDFLRTRSGHYLHALVRLGRRRRGGTPAADERAAAQVAVLTHVAVRADARGCGIGSRLVDDFVAAARAAGADEAHLVTDAQSDGNHAFYRRSGWRHRGDRTDRDGRPISWFTRRLS
jgi:ribosomal protein S18 acetylase RimI-like enzyme